MEEELETINVGIVGHIDHGKTTLLYKLSGKWTDTHSEELKKGITIKLGYADIVIKKEGDKLTTDKNSKGIPVRKVTFIDAPGHEMLMATMLSGATIIDAAILVIAADEGIRSQTKEHLLALEAKKVKNIIIVQNKIDLVKKEEALKNYEEIKNFVKGTIAENSPIIPISAQQGINIDILLEKLCEIKIPPRDLSPPPLFFIARSFDVNKPGTLLKDIVGGVLGGSIKKGIFRVGDSIEIKPGRIVKKQNQTFYETIKTKIVSIRSGDTLLKEAKPGGSLAIETELDPILTKGDFLAGGVVSLENSLPEIKERISIKFELFKEIWNKENKRETVIPIQLNELLMLSINCSTTVGYVKEVKNNVLTLSLKIPVVPIKNEPIGIARNINGHWRLIGHGELID